MAIAVRQTLASSRNSATSISRTFASAVLSGSLLVAHGATSGASGEPVVSDDVNGVWPNYVAGGYWVQGDATSQIFLWSYPNTSAGTPTVTMDPQGASSSNDLTLLEVTGVVYRAPRDVSVTNTGTFHITDVSNQQAFTPTVTTGVLSVPDQIVFWSFSHTGVDTTLGTDVGNGYTQADENEVNGGGQAYNVAYKIVSAVTSVALSGSAAAVGAGTGGAGNGTWFAGVASFRAPQRFNLT